MKIFISLFLCFIAHFSLAQIVVDPGIPKRYNSALKKLPKEYQQMLSKVDFKQTNTMNGIAIFYLNRTDTVNKKDAPIEKISRFLEADTNRKTGKITHRYVYDTKKDHSKDIEPNWCTVVLRKDTLIIDAGFMFPDVIHKIIKGKVQSTYDIYQKGDKFYKLTLTQPGNDALSVPTATPTFKLSTVKFEPGKILYGEISFATNDYYIDNPEFKSKYIHTRQLGKYVFKALINVEKH